MIAYKGFDENLCCRGFQYEIGKEYEQEGAIRCCENGFHACTNPFDVLEYYGANGNNRYCIVEQSETIITDDRDSKQASSKIKIKSEIDLDGISVFGARWIGRNTNPYSIISTSKEEDSDKSYTQINLDRDHARIGTSGSFDHIFSSSYSTQIASSGDLAYIGSSGNTAHICSSGSCAKIGASGYNNRISSSGHCAKIGEGGYSTQIGSSGNVACIGSGGTRASIASSGVGTQIGSNGAFACIASSGIKTYIGSIGTNPQIASSGNRSFIGSSGNGAQIASSGYNTYIVSSGNYAQIASSGDETKIESTGECSIICCAGDDSMIKAKKGSWITLSEWRYSKEKKRNIPVCVKTEFVDGKRIKENTWYKLINGEFKEQ